MRLGFPLGIGAPRGGPGIVPVSFGLTIGNTNANIGSGFTSGSTWAADATGTVNFLTVLYGTSGPYGGNFRLVIYAASSPTTWGAKLAETAAQSGINANQAKKVALLSPLNVVAGTLYALCVQTDNNFGVRADTGQTCRYFSDSYGDGAAASAGGLSSFAGAPVILASSS